MLHLTRTPVNTDDQVTESQDVTQHLQLWYAALAMLEREIMEVGGHTTVTCYTVDLDSSLPQIWKGVYWKHRMIAAVRYESSKYFFEVYDVVCT